MLHRFANKNTKSKFIKHLKEKKNIMFVVYLNFVLFSVILLSIPSSSQPQAVFQLLQFRQSLTQASQLLLPWNQSSSLSAHCKWTGISCYSKTDFRVKVLNLTEFGVSGILETSISRICMLQDLITLDLSGNNFTGTVPPLLGNCSILNTIFLHSNSLYGRIPRELFQSRWLVQLNLGYNQLSGNIPSEIENCKSLEYLGLYNNQLTGQIPTGLFSLPNLKFLYLLSNNLTGTLPDLTSPCSLSDLLIHENSFRGSLPLSLGNCHNLTFLSASNTNLGGIIPPNLFNNLQKLERLYLDGNDFEGQIPDSLWRLSNLQELVATNNNFEGSIPEDIAQLNQLTYFDLSGNKMTGQIPSSIGSLRSLQHLILYKNMFNGFIPPQIGNCSSLVQIRLDENHIHGVLPTEICDLQSLKFLYVSDNQIMGLIPRCLERLTSLEELGLYSNNLTGRIPSQISTLTNLTYLSLAHNNLSGVVPSDLGKNNVPGLLRLDLTGNRLTGEIPSEICSGNSLVVLTLGDNQFNGSFPIQIATCKSLIRVILKNNLLKGSIPDDMENSTSISYLDLRGNLFEGNIPAAFGFWRNLSMIDFSENNFKGAVPKEFGELQNLEELRISSNGLTGEVPLELTHCPRISELDLSKNNLSGRIPSQIVSSLSLQIVRLQENKLSGVIPDDFTSSQSLQELQLGDNMLEGAFPCNLSRVRHFSSVLNMSMNQFSGEIPKCLGNLDMLEVLDISSNYFSGKIPSEVDNMISLSYLNISFNRLSGRIPAGWAKILENYPGSSFGNPELCLSTRYCGKDGKSNKNIKIIVGLATGSVLLVTGLLASLCIFVKCIRHSHPLSPHQSLLDQKPRSEELPEGLSFQDIVRATEGWSEKYIIGKGKHGTVYRTESAKSKRQWAVKKMDLSETKFSTEQRTLSMVKHRNVLKMGGYSIRNGYGFIVTDFMPEGTLYDLMHKRRSEQTLNWETLHQIALGIAQGLSYLHHDCVPQIIHRDIKSDNVLLNSDLEPKIGDFGMAKLETESGESTTVSTIVGTLGYIAPENAYSTKLTEKCDVYSYGVILLELLCRKLPVDPSFDEGLDIVSWARMNLQVQNDFLDEEIKIWDKKDQEEALVMMNIALQCTETIPDVRPSMRDVVGILAKLNCQKTSATGSRTASGKRSK